ncbi:hypothetical protein TOPH_00163 [Tolypocladium ophioglossoides CBS 100239]|uniref:Uncharacterized protein n=1 Tax=Tolypocladium ophioglossoides (strain CBS 100239) TaxID=1163406 RepID=A0A0L0NM93_TOLOC|nr:hypothetical protein TOPH_00163 [Tolypocladium ophioglossoides CBS 100239]
MRDSYWYSLGTLHFTPLLEDALHPDVLENLLAWRRNEAADSVSLEDAEPAQGVSWDFIQRDHFRVLPRIRRGFYCDLGRLCSQPVVDDVHSTGPLARGLDANILWLDRELPLGVVMRQHIPNRQRVVQGEAWLVPAGPHRLNLVECSFDEVRRPHGKGASGVNVRLDALRKVVLGDEMGGCDVQRGEGQLQLARKLGRVGREGRKFCGDGRHRGCRRQRREGINTSSSHGICIAVELGHGSDVALDIHGAAHDHELLDSEEGLGVLGRGEGNIGQRSYGADRDGVDWVLLEDPQDLLVGGLLGRREIGREGAVVYRVVCIILEERLPSVRGAEVRVHVMDVV